jgi:replication factor C large subunit
MWRYAGMLMTGGAVVSKSRTRGGFVKYQPPSLWRKMGQMRSRRNMRNNIAVKIGSHCNESMRYSRLEVAGMYSRLIREDEYASDVVAILGLDMDEMLHMVGAKKVTKKLQAVYDDAQEKRQVFVPTDEPAFFVEKAAPKKDPSQLSFDSLPASNNTSLDSAFGKDTTKKDEVSEPKNEAAAKPQKTLFDF